MNVISVSFLVYIFAVIAFGVYSTRFARATSDDFLLAGRGLGAWVAALSSSASAESGWVTMGLVGMSFKVGLGALWIVPGTLLAFLFNWLVLAHRLHRASVEQRSITLLDILVSPYSGVAARLIRAVGILILVTMLTTYMAAQITAAAKAIEATFDWTYLWGVAIGAGLVLIYTTTGGFRAVAWTDVVQSIMMIAAVLAAVASTADSQLLVSASAVSHDLVVRLLRIETTERSRVLIHRTTVLLVGLSATLIAMSESRTIFHFVLYAWAGLGAALGPALILTLLWHRATGWGVLAGMLVGFTTAVAWIEIPVLNELIYEMAPAFLLATLAIVGVSILAAPRARR